MKTKTITNAHKISDIYSYEDTIVFYAVDNKSTIRGYSTTCKEEIGSQCVRDKHNKFVMLLPERLTDEQVAKVLSYIHTREKEAKVLKTIIKRVKDSPKSLFVEHSQRWSRNSVAHSILITWLRFAIACHIEDMCDVKEKDRDHLSSCFWLLDIVKKQGLRVFGTFQHPKYDVGMVSFTYRVREQNGFANNNAEPEEQDYDSYDEFDEAYMEWEDRIDEFTNMSAGDLDGPLPHGDRHAYSKLMEMYGVKK